MGERCTGNGQHEKPETKIHDRMMTDRLKGRENNTTIAGTISCLKQHN